MGRLKIDQNQLINGKPKIVLLVLLARLREPFVMSEAAAVMKCTAKVIHCE